MRAVCASRRDEEESAFSCDLPKKESSRSPLRPRFVEGVSPSAWCKVIPARPRGERRRRGQG